MPALKFSDPFFEEDLKVTKKKMNLLRQTLAPNSEKKKIKPRASEPEDGEINSDSGDAQDHSPERKKGKKRKSHEDYANGESKSELRESSKEGRKSPLRDGSSKKQRVKEKTYSSDDEERDEEEEERGEEVNPNAVSNFRISEILRETLKSKGIESLFPIQAMTFDIILNGSDLVGRARTGQGKTLAFVLPILESLTNEHGKAGRKMGYGRSPSVLVLAPTRELAKQVNADFEFYGGAVGLSSCCLYGGSPYRPQEIALKRGVDIVVGTPGRIKDHIERENIDLRSLKFRVLDEADEMLNMGFVDDVENILGRVEDSRKVQTLLFSATMPDWVKKIASRFLKPEKKTADLVGDDKMKASASVRHIVLPCFYSARAQLIPDIIRCYSSGGRAIVFTETKNSASELAGSLPGARALHGDIQQSQREVTLAGFRSGKFLVLVATDVAARGLDINDVQLILQCEPPRDVETYIHRSGRTGRAGNTGVAVMLYDRKKSYMIPQIERLSGVKFEHISAPQPADIAKSAGADAAETISKVSDSVVPVFRPAAEQLLNSTGVSAIDLVAKAMAKISGYTEIKRRSLLTSQEDYATVLLGAGRTMHTPTYAFSILRRFIPEEKITKLRGLTLTADGKGAVFDVPSNDLDMVIAGKENAEMVSIDVLNILPPLQDNTNKNQSRGWQGGRGGSDRRGSGGGGGYTGGKGSGGGFLGRRGSGLSNGSQGGRGGGGGHRPQRRY